MAKLFRLVFQTTKNQNVIPSHALIEHNHSLQRRYYILPSQRLFLSENEEIPVLDYEKFREMHKLSNMTPRKILVQLLHVSPDKVEQQMNKYRKLNSIWFNNYLLIYQFLINNDVKRETIRTDFYPLTVPLDILKEKLEVLHKFDMDINVALKFLRLEVKPLQIFLAKCHEQGTTPGKKVKILSEILKVDESIMISKFTQNRELRVKNLNDLISNIQICFDNNITTRYILYEPNLMVYPKQILERKIALFNRIHQNKRNHVKLALNKESLLEYVKNVEKEVDFMPPDLTTEEYMQRRMNCGESMIQYLIYKNPSLKRKSLGKLKEIFDLFDEMQMDKTKLLTLPILFQRDINVMKNRLNALQNNGLPINLSIYTLLLSDKKFEEYLEKKRQSTQSLRSM